MARQQVGMARNGKFYRQLTNGAIIRSTDYVYGSGLDCTGVMVGDDYPEEVGKKWIEGTYLSVFYREISLGEFYSRQAFSMDSDDDD